MRSTVEVVIAPITVDELRREGGALMKAHYDEVAKHKDVMVLDPDWRRFEILEVQECLLSLGARAETGELVGYSVGLVVPHPHYKQLLFYQNDVLFVTAAMRRSRIGLDLIDRTEAEAAKRGAKLVCWHAKKGSTLDRLLDRYGYGVQDIIYSRTL